VIAQSVKCVAMSWTNGLDSQLWHELSACHNVQTGFGAHSGSYPISTVCPLPGSEGGHSIKMTPHLHFVQWLGIHGSFISTPPYAFMVWCLCMGSFLLL